MLNIFLIGSCRIGFSATDKKFIKNWDLTHTTKEVLAYLDIFDGKITKEDYPNIESLMLVIKKQACKIPEFEFDYILYSNRLNKSDIVLIEISSLKIYHKNGFIYQLNRAKKNNFSTDIHIQTEAEFIEDIKEIERRINKPIIFIGHVDLDFSDNINIKSKLNIEGRIEIRGYLDSLIRKHCKNHIICSDVFKDIHYTGIIDIQHDLNDTSHLTEYASTLLLQDISEKIKTLL